jgi:hypothetical protein
MGIAVDDTIHYLTWFRYGIRIGLDRNAAIIEAYRRVGTAMTQTTLIAGLGLAVFALSTFTPTQRFGVMMVAILAAALVGDLIFLPALLAGPLGKAFCPRRRSVEPPPKPIEDAPPVPRPAEAPLATGFTTPESDPQTPHSPVSRARSSIMRRDTRHSWPDSIDRV